MKTRERDVFAASLMALGGLMILVSVVGFFIAVIFAVPWYVATFIFGILAMLIAGVIG